MKIFLNFFVILHFLKSHISKCLKKMKCYVCIKKGRTLKNPSALSLCDRAFMYAYDFSQLCQYIYT